MSVLQALRREHQLLTGLLDRLEELCRSQSPVAGLEIRSMLDLLFPALSQHECIESLVFANARGSERAARESVDDQHRELHDRQRDILAILMSGKRCTDPTLRTSTISLCQALREHCRLEEELLWPLAAKRIRALAASSEDPEGWERVRALEAEIAKRNIAIERAVGSKPGEAL